MATEMKVVKLSITQLMVSKHCTFIIFKLAVKKLQTVINFEQFGGQQLVYRLNQMGCYEPDAYSLDIRSCYTNLTFLYPVK